MAPQEQEEEVVVVAAPAAAAAAASSARDAASAAKHRMLQAQLAALHQKSLDRLMRWEKTSATMQSKREQGFAISLTELRGGAPPSRPPPPPPPPGTDWLPALISSRRVPRPTDGEQARGARRAAERAGRASDESVAASDMTSPHGPVPSMAAMAASPPPREAKPLHASTASPRMKKHSVRERVAAPQASAAPEVELISPRRERGSREEMDVGDPDEAMMRYQMKVLAVVQRKRDKLKGVSTRSPWSRHGGPRESN
jgi:hypothetical protein